MKPFLIVAIDGGAATGKSSTARSLAERRYLLHVDTGAHYRALAFSCLAAELSPDTSTGLCDFLSKVELETELRGISAVMSVNGRVLRNAEIRSPEVNQNVSRFAALPELRSVLLEYQRGLVEFARRRGFGGLVVEGRDIGSVILPQADIKIFLDADDVTKAERREKEGQQDSIAFRDLMDSRRKTAPLIRADDAVSIDTSSLTLEQVIAQVIELID